MTTRNPRNPRTPTTGTSNTTASASRMQNLIAGNVGGTAPNNTAGSGTGQPHDVDDTQQQGNEPRTAQGALNYSVRLWKEFATFKNLTILCVIIGIALGLGLIPALGGWTILVLPVLPFVVFLAIQKILGSRKHPPNLLEQNEAARTAYFSDIIRSLYTPATSKESPYGATKVARDEMPVYEDAFGEPGEEEADDTLKVGADAPTVLQVGRTFYAALPKTYRYVGRLKLGQFTVKRVLNIDHCGVNLKVAILLSLRLARPLTGKTVWRLQNGDINGGTLDDVFEILQGEIQTWLAHQSDAPVITGANDRKSFTDYWNRNKKTALEDVIAGINTAENVGRFALEVISAKGVDVDDNIEDDAVRIRANARAEAEGRSTGQAAGVLNVLGNTEAMGNAIGLLNAARGLFSRDNGQNNGGGNNNGGNTNP